MDQDAVQSDPMSDLNQPLTQQQQQQQQQQHQQPQQPRRQRRRNPRQRDFVRHQDTTAAEVQRLFQRFLSEYSSEQIDNDAAAPSSSAENQRDYILQIDQMVENDRTTLHVDYSHLTIYMTPLADLIRKNYIRFSPFLCNAVQNLIREMHPEYAHEEDNRGFKDFYVSFYNMTQGFAKIRDLRTDKIGQLLSIEGTVTRTSEVRPELLFGTFECNDCKEVIRLVEQQFKYTEPTSCINPTCTNNKSWTLRPSESKFVDWQKIRVQESSSEIPPGSMPRTIDIIVRNESVEQCKPGDKCLFTGAFIVVPDVAKLIGATKFQTKGQERSSKQSEGVTGIRGMGVRDLSYKTAFLSCAVQPKHTRWGQVNIRGDDPGADGDGIMSFTDAEKTEIQAIRNTPHLYTKMARCIAPSVYGHDEIKRGILLMLFGGLHKESSESHIGLRGDINICIVGDPSTAKSQFLKFVVSFLPRAVYTSGKASTAAGLTASVSRDPDTGEFGIEAGALMLADNGICCIDEFNTMDDKDQVAIHEAMEQQTISIAKAGIHATLNARASILAAANPIGGRYDRSRPLKHNVTLTPPILSRFDLFFVVLDDCNEAVDTHIAERIVRVHQRLDEALENEFSMDAIQKYIRYARTIKPRASPEARERFAHHYVTLRQSDISGAGNNSYRITVRQLESMIRLSEAIARLHCDDTIKVAYVEEAARLLKQSILRVESDDLVFDNVEPDEISGDQMVDTDPTQTDTQEGRGEAGEATQSSTEPKQKMKLKFSEYQRIANMLVLHLRRESDRRSDSTYTRTSLRHWYLDQIESQIVSEEMLLYHTNIITKVIRRLIEVDHVLLESDDDILQVHPNYDITNSQSIEHH